MKKIIKESQLRSMIRRELKTQLSEAKSPQSMTDAELAKIYYKYFLGPMSKDPGMGQAFGQRLRAVNKEVKKRKLSNDDIKKMAKIGESKKQLKEDHGEQAFYAGDGWNEDAFDDIGLMDWIEDVEELAYEIRNARRGAYYGNPVSGDTLEGMVEYLSHLYNILEEVIDYLRSEV